jgi:hypothetical protein
MLSIQVSFFTFSLNECNGVKGSEGGGNKVKESR